MSLKTRVVSSNVDKRKPTVIVVGGFPPEGVKIFGGIVTSCRALIRSSIPSRFNLVLVDTTQKSNPPPLFIVRLVLSIRRLFEYVLKIVTNRPDAVLLFTSNGASLVEKGCMAWFARILGIPSLMFPRGGEMIQDARKSSFQRAWIRLALNGSRIFLCQGPAWHRFATRDMAFAADRVVIVPNWTASENLLRIGESRSAMPAITNPRILFLGWLEKEKGIFELLEVFDQLCDTYSCTLTIAGRGNAENAARKFVKHRELDGRVHFAGWVAGSDLESVLMESDILVLPSWAEGLPNAMIEAMAAGLAVVVSAVGNIPDVITNNKQALLVPPKDVAALKIALEKVLRDPQLRTELAQCGHEFAKSNYSVEPAVELLSKTIEALITNNQDILQKFLSPKDDVKQR